LDGSGGDRNTAARKRSGVVVRRVEAVVNAASGSVGAGAAEALEAIVSRYSVGVRVANAAPRDIASAVRAAVDAGPDLVVILAGDGTAALAADLAGPDGPLIAPLPGGTMNMLPHALYGPLNWKDALVSALSEGVVRPVSGGEIGGKAFYVAAILGAPALWANAREAVRARKFRQAWVSARIAASRAFAHRLHFTLGDGVADEARALTLMCPMVSRGPVEDGALDAAALDPKDVAELVRLGFHAVTGDWRTDPSVRTTLTRAGMAWAKGRIPAILDGEPIRLEHRVTFGFRPVAFRALAPPPQPPLAPHFITFPVDAVTDGR
jgi:diacylglycerol kinase family enzyme